MSFADDDQPRYTNEEWTRALEALPVLHPGASWAALPRAVQSGFCGQIAEQFNEYREGLALDLLRENLTFPEYLTGRANLKLTELLKASS